MPEKPIFYRAKADAQDAHEAIRPTAMQYHPEEVRAHLTPDQYDIYKLIWNRFVASQMPPATFDETTVDISAAAYLFRVKGSVPKFAGWMAVYNQEDRSPIEQRTGGPGPDSVSGGGRRGDGVLPALAAKAIELELKELKPEQKFTQPPPRYSEATLVKAMEENGIGRPSTYASIIGVIQARDYVNKIEGRFKPTILGTMLVEKLLSPAFDDILDIEYTRELEEDLDKIEEGKANYERRCRPSTRSSRRTEARRKEMIDLKKGVEGSARRATSAARRCDQGGQVRSVPRLQRVSGVREYPRARDAGSQRGGKEIEEVCENCGKPMAMKRGRFGQFLACTGYPECKTTRKVIATKGGLTAAKPDQILDEKCPKC